MLLRAHDIFESYWSFHQLNVPNHTIIYQRNVRMQSIELLWLGRPALCSRHPRHPNALHSHCCSWLMPNLHPGEVSNWMPNTMNHCHCQPLTTHMSCILTCFVRHLSIMKFKHLIHPATSFPLNSQPAPQHWPLLTYQQRWRVQALMATNQFLKKTMIPGFFVFWILTNLTSTFFLKHFGMPAILSKILAAYWKWKDDLSNTFLICHVWTAAGWKNAKALRCLEPLRVIRSRLMSLMQPLTASKKL